MTSYEKVQALVETRINGNSIRGNKTYENMLKQISLSDIQSYADGLGIMIYGSTKLQNIEQIRNRLE